MHDKCDYFDIVVFVAVLCVVKVETQYLLTRVIQGTPTSINRYPVMAQLLLDAWGTQNYVQHCAGVILTSRHVLSTAHCFQYNVNTGKNYSLPNYWKIRVGSTYRTRGGTIYSLKRIITHEDFNKTYFINDIAIVIITKQFAFNDGVRQATIIKQGVEIKPNSLCTLIGWGVLEPDGIQPDQLQHTTLATVNQDICSSRYSTIGGIIANSMMCAGSLDNGGPDGCFGDSGGPLVYKGVVVGIVSFGYSCGHKFFPGVYTKISHYTDWIVRITNTIK